MRKLRSFALMLAVLFAVPFILTACGKKDDGGSTNTDKTKLATPTNLIVKNNALTWLAVPNAAGYKVAIDSDTGSAHSVQTNSFSIAGLSPDKYYFCVMAVGSGNYTDSDWSANLEYTVEDTAPETYTVTWKNLDGTILKTDTNVAKGTTPTYSGAAPTKAEDAEYKYNFSGWMPMPAAITADTTYTAVFSMISQDETTYTITWKNHDGTTLEIDAVVEDDMPEFNSTAPTKAADADNTYAFYRWAPAVTAAIADQTYTATFTATARRYNITIGAFEHGTVTADKTTAARGETVTITAVPAADYVLDTITVTGGITVTAGANNTHTFTMAGNNVTVTVTFKSAPQLPADEQFEIDLDTTFAAMTGMDMTGGSMSKLTVDGTEVTLADKYDVIINDNYTNTDKVRFDAGGNVSGYYTSSGEDYFQLWEDGKMYEFEMVYVRYDLPVTELGEYTMFKNKAQCAERMRDNFSGMQNITAENGGYESVIDMTGDGRMANGVITVADGKITEIVITWSSVRLVSIANLVQMLGITETELTAEFGKKGITIDENSEIEIVTNNVTRVEFRTDNSPIPDTVPAGIEEEQWVDLYTVTIQDAATDETISTLYGRNRVSSKFLYDLVELPTGKVYGGLYKDKAKAEPIDGNGYDITADTTIYVDVQTLDAARTELLTMIDELGNTEFEVYFYGNAAEPSPDYITVLQYAVNEHGDLDVMNGYQKTLDGTRIWREFNGNSNPNYYYIDGDGLHVSNNSLVLIVSSFGDMLRELSDYIKMTATTVTVADTAYTVEYDDKDDRHCVVTVRIADGAITAVIVEKESGEKDGAEIITEYFINDGESKLVERPDKDAEWFTEFYTTFVYFENGKKKDWGNYLVYITDETVLNFISIDDYEFGGFYYDSAMMDALTADEDDRYFFDPAKADEYGSRATVYVKLTPKA